MEKVNELKGKSSSILFSFELEKNFKSVEIQIKTQQNNKIAVRGKQKKREKKLVHNNNEKEEEIGKWHRNVKCSTFSIES